MREISITIDGVTGTIEIQSKVIIINYSDITTKSDNAMTINYSDNWAPSRALQHLVSIIECINRKEIV